MRTQTLSIVVGTSACQASCPFCVSQSTGQAQASADLNIERLDIACRLAQQAREGLIEVIITGKGEPTLYPEHITTVLSTLRRYDFPLVTFQTNGERLIHPNLMGPLHAWRAAGLTTICLSLCDYDPALNNDIMGLPATYDPWKLAEKLVSLGFSVRVNCTMTGKGVHDVADVCSLLSHCKAAGVAQCTVREVAGDTDWINNNRPTPIEDIHYYFQQNGTPLLGLPHGGTIYDYLGQNLCVTNCLTDNVTPDNLRQIIYFPDGRNYLRLEIPGSKTSMKRPAIGSIILKRLNKCRVKKLKR